jgi:hypothetical protein
LSQTFGIHEELHHLRESTNMDVDPPAQQNAPELSFDASKDMREYQIHLMDPSKTARVSNSLSPHWKVRSSSSSVSTGGCSPSVQQICQASLGNSPSTS